METRVYISTSVDFKTRVLNWWSRLRLKEALQHVGLLVTLMAYTVAGGLVFRKFEYPAEINRINYFNQTILAKQQLLIGTIINNTKVQNLDRIIDYELNEYKHILYKSFEAGIPLNPKNDDTLYKWTVLKSVFFSSSVLTTIGYGNIVPMTTEGRAFCIVFALVGIPLTLTVIADWGRLFASTLSTCLRKIPPVPKKFRNAMVARRTSSYAFSAVCFLFVYLAAGAGLFVIWEKDWSFFEGFYFCFVTMTTIGFGDFVPKQPKYMLFCTLYILVGLALTSTIIELVRRQYAQSWRQLRALRGPLAENFRKFADNAPNLDVLAFQQDLMKVLTVVTMPSRKSISRKNKTNKRHLDEEQEQIEWESSIEAVIRDITVNVANQEYKQPPVVQIIIYESSV